MGRQPQRTQLAGVSGPVSLRLAERRNNDLSIIHDRAGRPRRPRPAWPSPRLRLAVRRLPQPLPLVAPIRRSGARQSPLRWPPARINSRTARTASGRVSDVAKQRGRRACRACRGPGTSTRTPHRMARMAMRRAPQVTTRPGGQRSHPAPRSKASPISHMGRGPASDRKNRLDRQPMGSRIPIQLQSRRRPSRDTWIGSSTEGQPVGITTNPLITTGRSSRAHSRIWRIWRRWPHRLGPDLLSRSSAHRICTGGAHPRRPHPRGLLTAVGHSSTRRQ